MERMRDLGPLLAAAALLCLPVASPAAQEAPAPAGYSTNASDKAECERQLNIIYGAIQQYRSEHDNQYPSKLSDLNPGFIRDLKFLTCPVVRDQGGLRPWKKKFRELSPDESTSYSYEFSPVALDYNQWRGLPKKTWQDFKLRAAEVIDKMVPIVRCHAHRPRLNLAMDGPIYESGILWERNFTTNNDLLTFAALFRTPASRPLTAAEFPPRDPRADTRLLDLTDRYNATLTSSWQGFPGNHLGGLPAGVQEFDGVRFDVRGIIQLRGVDLPATFPKEVGGIPVGQKCRQIHFLHAVSFLYRPGATNGIYVIGYADGRVHEIPLVYGQQIADWWCDPEDAASPTEAKSVWTGTNEAALAYGKELRLYRFTWRNPREDVLVSTITFDSGARKDAPFLIAITVE